MTVTKTYRVEMGDVEAIRLECKCGTFMSFLPKDPCNIPQMCPNCRAEWMPHMSMEYGLIDTFIRNVIALRQIKAGAPCRLSLEFKLPES